ncbi:MAG: SLBB domain-containing protein [Armatimonadota bacterium]
MRRFACYALALLMVLQTPGVVLSDETAAPAYVLAPDDVVSVMVVNFPNLSTQATVLPDGTISVPILGSVKASGKTTEELAQYLAREWDRFVVRPSVTVSVTQKRKAAIVVNGFAARLGAIEYRPGMRLSDALAEVGGASPAGDITKVRVTRRSGESQTYDMTDFSRLAGTERDVLLQEGDIIFIPERRTQVSVIGEVIRPGSFDYRDEMTVLDALGLAGGVRESADLHAATIEEDGVERKLDLDALLRKGDMSVNAKLKPGARIMVPEWQNRTYVFGAVARPGFYPYKEGDRILDALNASGLAQNAEMREVRVIRVDKTKGEAVVTRYNLEEFLKDGKMEANAMLSAGDVVFIPDRKRGFQWQDAFAVMSGIGLIDQTIRILTGNRYRY